MNTVVCSNVPGPRTSLVLRGGSKSYWNSFFMPNVECPGVSVITIDDYMKIGVYGDRLRLKRGAKEFVSCFNEVVEEVIRE